MSQHIDPRNPFYLSLAVSNNDGTLDPEDEGPTGYATEQEAIAAAQDLADEHGVESYIYRLVPVCRVHRVTVIVERLEEKEP
jgi:hypothetical protein